MSSRAEPTRGAEPSVQADEATAGAPEPATTVVVESLHAAPAPPPTSTPDLAAADSRAQERARQPEPVGGERRGGSRPGVGGVVVTAAPVAEEKLLPYTLQIVVDDAPIRSVGLEAPAALEFARGGAEYAVTVGRGEDGRWSVASEYRPEGDLLAAERRERYFRLADSDDSSVDPREVGTPMARFRIAQPLVGSTRLYAVVVNTADARKAAQITTPVKGAADAPE